MQGGLFEDLRAENAEALSELDFPGYAVGGLSVGEARPETMATAAYSVAMLPPDRPRYMMGMGTPEDLVELCEQGYDLFDCVIPTRNGRNGNLFTETGSIAIRNAAELESYGFEAELMGLPTEGLALGALIGFNIAEYKNFPNGECPIGSPFGCTQDLSGKTLEVPIKRILMGEDPEAVVSRGSLANPEALDWFVAFAASRSGADS